MVKAFMQVILYITFINQFYVQEFNKIFRKIFRGKLNLNYGANKDRIQFQSC
jgi:hypothetical protein